ncbi:MAG: rhomboid family intramembrane serine protease [Candidatus Limnocylindrales bacterium]
MPSDKPAGSQDPFAAGPLDRLPALAVLQHADALAGQGEYQQAAPFYSRVVGHRDPDLHVAALLGLAECRYRMDEEDAAVETWKLATQAPDTPLSWVAWRQLAAARVRQGDLRGALDAYREADRRAPADARAEIASRLGWLSKELGDRRAAGRYFGRSRAATDDRPVVTYAILTVTIAIGLVQFFGGAVGVTATNLLMLDKAAVARGECWRLLSVVLVHDPSDPLHLAFNMYALYLVGPLVERIYGRAQYLLIYVLAAVAASVTSYIFLPDNAVGASGAIFGLFAVVFIAYRVRNPILGRGADALARQIGFLIVFNLVLDVGLIGGGVGIDIFAHIGGLIAGFWLGLILLPTGLTLASLWQHPAGAPKPAAAPVPGVLRLAGVLLLVVLLAAGLQLGTVIRTGSTGFIGESMGGLVAQRAAPDVDPPSVLAATGRAGARVV